MKNLIIIKNDYNDYNYFLLLMLNYFVMSIIIIFIIIFISKDNHKLQNKNQKYLNIIMDKNREIAMLNGKIKSFEDLFDIKKLL